ncbi:transferase [Pseudomonas putida]|nr:transferase [Pseudomonas putida]
MFNKKFALFSADAVVEPDLQLKGPVRLGAVTIASKCVIGKYSYLGSGCKIGSSTRIGNYCSISTNVNIGPGSYPTSLLSSHPFQFSDKLFTTVTHYKNVNRVKRQSTQPGAVLGHDVWIGQDVIILRGVKIAHGAVVEAGSVVTDDVPAYAVVAGSPAKVIGYRFDSNTIAQLLELKWWTLNPIEMSGVVFSDIDTAIEQIKDIKVNIAQRKVQRLATQAVY